MNFSSDLILPRLCNRLQKIAMSPWYPQMMCREMVPATHGLQSELNSCWAETWAVNLKNQLRNC